MFTRKQKDKHKQLGWGDRLTPVQLILLFYLVASIISSVMLALPIAHKANVDIPLMDIIFTAVSALSVTGLSTIEIHTTFSTTGIVFLGIIVQFGMFGIMAIGTFVWI